MLIILSLFLTGSLWFDNYQELSFIVSSIHNNMLDRFDAVDEQSIVYDKIITPYKVTVINPDENKWIFYETDNMSTNAWSIVKARLNSLNAETEIITGKVKEWDGLFSRKSVVLEFGGPLEYDILRLAIPNLPKETEAFNDVEKIAVTKSLEGNTVYILQNENNKKSLYKILLKGEDKEIETFMENCENIKADARYVELAKVGTTNFYNNKEVVSASNVLFPISNVRSHRDVITSLQCSPYFDIEDEYEINRFVIDVFNNTDFAKFVTNDESNIFINDDKSSVKFERNGVVEYINNSKLPGEVASASRNFNTAMEFINDIRVYDNVYLLSAREDEGLYTFKFSVAFNGALIGLERPIVDDDMHALIEIRVEEDSVRYFKGKLLDIKPTNNSTYILNFTHNILDGVLDDVDENTKVNVSLVELMYTADDEGMYYPDWVVKHSDKKSEEQFVTLINTVKK